MRRSASLLVLLLTTSLSSQAPKSLTVLIDDSYPPYAFRDADGGLQGLLIDQWGLFEEKTGIDVTIRAGDWGVMLEEMAAGEGDVLDTAFYTEARARIYDYGQPYASIPVPVYVSASITGVTRLADLRGLVVGVKAGDSCIDALSKAEGIELLEYPGYAEVIEAALQGQIRAFCVDQPPALYYIYHAGAAQLFREAFILSKGQFHRVFRKGDSKTLETVEAGFASLDRKRVKAIEQKWLGRPLTGTAELRRALLAVSVSVGIVLVLIGLSLYLRALVKRRTAQLKKAVKDLEAARENLETLLHASADYLFVMDKAGTFLECFASRPETLLLPPEKFIGKSPSEVLPPDLARQTMEAIDMAGRTEIETSFEYELEQEGKRHCYEARVIPVTGGRILAVIRDITAAKAHDEDALRVQKLESLGLFAGGIAHDFNNILAVISGNLSIARMAGPEKATEFIEKAESAAMRARSLTAQLLTFSRGGEPVLSPVSMQALVRESAAFALSGSACALDMEESEDPFMAEVDKAQMSQAIQNLVLNASQAMPAGGTVRIRMKRVAPSGSEGERICVSVEDSGRGIDPSKIGRIFDPYYSAKSGGTGLGLSVCHAIVRRHGGEISVRSEPGKGSIFSFSLPASAAPAEEPVLDIPKGERTLALPARALVMDDEADLREILKAMLASYGCQADTAGGGREGLDMFSAALADGEPYGLVIADLTTPGGMGGAEMMKIMRGTDATFKSIIVSGYSDLPALAEYRKHGFDAFLRKPFTAAQLRDTLASLFGEA